MGMGFGPSKTSATDLGPMSAYVKTSNLGFKMDSDFKLDGHISYVVKSIF